MAAGRLGDGAVERAQSSTGVDPLTAIRDAGLEWAPHIVAIIGAISLVGLTFYLIRRGLTKARGAMRL